MRHILVATILACLAVLPAVGQSAAPDQIIKEAVDLLEDGLDGRREELKADKEALYSFIDGILLPRFHREYAAAMVLGRNWRSASDEQKTRFVEAFYATLLQRYAEGILEFDTNRVQILPFRGDDSKRITTVKTRVKLDDGTDVMVNYDLVNAKGGWRMFNVTIEGVSYVVNYRKEFAAEIKDTSLAAVIERLEDEAGIARNE
jgi:phospholipid transport system substrate-binding protein